MLGALFGVPGALADPVMDLHAQASGAVVAANDNRDAALAPRFSDCNAFPWTIGGKDAAMVATLAPGAYTAVVHSSDGGSGVALAEVREIPSDTSTSRLVNLSSRTFVGTGDNVRIAGFVVHGSTARTVLIRAAGPALTQIARLTGTLVDPAFDLRNQADGSLLASADDWDAMVGSTFAAVGAFPWKPDSRDAALVVTLDPGAYTAVVRGKSNSTGLALVEVYALP